MLCGRKRRGRRLMTKALDRLETRIAVGCAVREMNRIREERFAETEAEQSKLYKVWRDALEVAREKEHAYDYMMRKCHVGIKVACFEQQKIINIARIENPDLLTYSEDPDSTPVTCEASGLAIFEGDELYGRVNEGPVVLKGAVAVKVSVDGGAS
jgi:hypothetical protein